MENIYISIIVPAYNIENYIGRCLDSLLKQQYKKLEIIVVDDGSTDGTGKIIEQYAAMDQRIISIHKANGGVSSARLAGLKRATGTYIGFVDGDDYVEPTMYQCLLSNALKYCADISHCGYKMVFPNGREDNYYGTEKVIEQDRKEALLALLNGDYLEPGLWNKLYHNSVFIELEKSEIWDPEIRINEDLLMNYLLFKEANKFIYEDKTLYHYMLRKNSAATSKNIHYKLTDPLKVIEIIKRDVEEDDELYAIVYCRYLRHLISIAIQEEWKKDATEAKNKLKREVVNKEFFKCCRSMKLRLMAIGASYLNGLYKVVRSLYDRISGVSKKYEID